MEHGSVTGSSSCSHCATFLLVPALCVDLGPDSRICPGERLGSFSVASAYKLPSVTFGERGMTWWKCIWRLNVSERIRCFAWQLMHGKLLTNKACHKWGLGMLPVTSAKGWMRQFYTIAVWLCLRGPIPFPRICVHGSSQ